MGTYEVSYSQGSALYSGLDESEIVRHTVEDLTLHILERPRILSL